MSLLIAAKLDAYKHNRITETHTLSSCSLLLLLSCNGILTFTTVWNLLTFFFQYQIKYLYNNVKPSVKHGIRSATMHVMQPTTPTVCPQNMSNKKLMFGETKGTDSKLRHESSTTPNVWPQNMTNKKLMFDEKTKGTVHTIRHESSRIYNISTFSTKTILPYFILAGGQPSNFRSQIIAQPS